MIGTDSSSVASPATTHWSRRFNHLWWPMIIFALVTPCVIGSLGSILAVVCALLCLPILFDRQARGDLAGQWGILVFPIVFGVLGIVFALNADQLSDMRFLFNFTSFPLAMAIYVLACRHSGGNWPLIIVALALIGTALGVLIGAWQIYFEGASRAGGLLNNENIYGRVILLLGFMSVPGLFLTKSAWRWLFLAGPILAIAGVFISGSRSTILSIPVAAVLVLAYVLTQPNSRRLIFAALAVVFAGLGIWLAFFAQFEGGMARIGHIASTISEVLTTGASGERGTQARLDIYAGAWDAFLRSPITGHGWADAVPASIVNFAPSPILDLAKRFPHVHSDFLQFATGAGFVGILVYLAILMAPLYSLRHRDALFWHRAYMACLLVSCYIMFGLLDSMFGYDTGISTYVMFTAILAGTFTSPPQSAAQTPA